MNAKVKVVGTIASFALLAVLGAAWPVRAQGSPGPYPRMAPLDQYLMDRDAEIALARSAAPESIARDAQVMVLGRSGYETAVQGKNGFVCLVERSWTKPIDDPDFWNQNLRGPLCLNPPAAQSYLPITIRKTELILAGEPKSQMAEEIKAAFDKKELPSLQPGAMCYMLSKEQYLDDQGAHNWHPHVMFFIPGTDSVARGENLEGSPVVTSRDPMDRMTVLMVLVSKWSDGTPAS